MRQCNYVSETLCIQYLLDADWHSVFSAVEDFAGVKGGYSGHVMVIMTAACISHLLFRNSKVDCSYMNLLK